MHQDISYILLSEEQINEKIKLLADAISKDFKDKNLLLVGVLKGSVAFMSELMKRLCIPVQIDFCKVSSYGRYSKSTGKINMSLDIERDDLDKYDVLIIEDIIDSGRTLSHLVEHFSAKGAKGVYTCTLLDKPSRREVEFHPDYIGFEIPDEFVVGFGLDFAENYRTLPYIGVLKAEIYSK